jgi:hypothetical protein
VHPAVLDPQHAVAVDDAGPVVGDHDRGAIRGEPCDGVQDLPLVLRIDRGGRLVEHDDGCVPQHRPGQRDALPLPTGQAGAALLDDVVVPARHRGDEPVGVRVPGGLLDLLVGRVQPTEPDVLADRRGEQHRLLEHDRDLLAQAGDGHLRGVTPS